MRQAVTLESARLHASGSPCSPAERSGSLPLPMILPQMATLEKAEELLEQLRAASYDAAQRDLQARTCHLHASHAQLLNVATGLVAPLPDFDWLPASACCRTSKTLLRSRASPMSCSRQAWRAKVALQVSAAAQACPACCASSLAPPMI